MTLSPAAYRGAGFSLHCCRHHAATLLLPLLRLWSHPASLATSESRPADHHPRGSFFPSKPDDWLARTHTRQPDHTNGRASGNYRASPFGLRSACNSFIRRSFDAASWRRTPAPSTAPLRLTGAQGPAAPFDADALAYLQRGGWGEGRGAAGTTTARRRELSLSLYPLLSLSNRDPH